MDLNIRKMTNHPPTPRGKSKDFCEFYSLNLDSEIELMCILWKERKIEKEALEQLGLTDVLKEAGDFFDLIQKAFIILLTLPCSTATIERTFYTLRRPLLFFLVYHVQLPP